MPNNAKIVVTWIEVILVLLLTAVGMGIWAAAARLITESLSEQEPKKEEFEDRRGLTVIQRKQFAAGEEWRATLSLRIQQHLEVDRLSSRIAALERTFPELRSANPAAGSIPAGVLETYREAQQQKLAATLLEQHLDGRLLDVGELLTRRERAVRDASRAVARDLKSTRTDLAWKRRIWTAILQGTGLAALLLVASILLSSSTARQAGVHRGPVLAATALLLAILCLYELLGAAFAAGFGGLLTLAGLWMLLRSVPERAPNGR